VTLLTGANLRLQLESRLEIGEYGVSFQSRAFSISSKISSLRARTYFHQAQGHSLLQRRPMVKRTQWYVPKHPLSVARANFCLMQEINPKSPDASHRKYLLLLLACPLVNISPFSESQDEMDFDHSSSHYQQLDQHSHPPSSRQSPCSNSKNNIFNEPAGRSRVQNLRASSSNEDTSELTILLAKLSALEKENDALRASQMLAEKRVKQLSEQQMKKWLRQEELVEMLQGMKRGGELHALWDFAHLLIPSRYRIPGIDAARPGVSRGARSLFYSRAALKLQRGRS
jgi:hypothetical protein